MAVRSAIFKQVLYRPISDLALFIGKGTNRFNAPQGVKWMGGAA